MPLHPAYAQVTALLAAVVVLIAGNGLLSTLVPLSAVTAGFPELTIGLIGSAYFGGMFVGCIATPRIVARAGHIRAFAALAAITTVTALAYPLLPEPWAWAAIRAVTGFCFAGFTPPSRVGSTTRPKTRSEAKCSRSTKSSTTSAARPGRI